MSGGMRPADERLGVLISNNLRQVGHLKCSKTRQTEWLKLANVELERHSIIYSALSRAQRRKAAGSEWGTSSLLLVLYNLLDLMVSKDVVQSIWRNLEGESECRTLFLKQVYTIYTKELNSIQKEFLACYWTLGEMEHWPEDIMWPCSQSYSSWGF